MTDEQKRMMMLKYAKSGLGGEPMICGEKDIFSLIDDVLKKDKPWKEN